MSNEPKSNTGAAEAELHDHLSALQGADPMYGRYFQERGVPVKVAIAEGCAVLVPPDQEFQRKYDLGHPFPGLPNHEVPQIYVPLNDIAPRSPDARYAVKVLQTEYTKVKEHPDVNWHPNAYKFGEWQPTETLIKVGKWLYPARRTPIPWLPRRHQGKAAVTDDPRRPVIIVENPVKAMAVDFVFNQRGDDYVCIGLCGVYTGMVDPEKRKSEDRSIELNATFGQYWVWHGRKAYIVFDAGRRKNPQVAQAEAQLVIALLKAGADVRVASLPLPDDPRPVIVDVEDDRYFDNIEKIGDDEGPDDFLVRNGNLKNKERRDKEKAKAAFQELLDKAVPGDPERRITDAIERGSGNKKGTLISRLGDLTFAALLYEGDRAGLHYSGLVAEVVGRGAKGIIADKMKWFKKQLQDKATKDAPAWKGNLKVSMMTGEPKPITPNVEIALQGDERLRGLLQWNEFAKRVEFSREPPWTGLYSAACGTARGAAWADHDDTRLCRYLSDLGLTVKEDVAAKAVHVVALEQPVHPVREYLKELTWDGVDRLGSWLPTYAGVDAGEYAAKAGMWWLMGAVARVEKPGTKHDAVLILEGEQGIGKSTLLRTLAGDEWFTDAKLDPASKEAAMSIQGYWLVEFAEGAIFSRSNAEDLKDFVSKWHDDVVPKFSNKTVRWPRQCSFALTINKDEDYLVDPTGNRRWWPVRCTTVDVDGLAQVRDQLWAEARHRVQAGEKWWPQTEEDKALFREAAARRERVDAWEEAIVEHVSSLERVSTLRLLQHLEVPSSQQNQGVKARVATVMKKLGWGQDGSTGNEQRDDGRRTRVRFWVRGPEAEPRTPAPAEMTEEDTEELMEALASRKVVPLHTAEDDEIMDAVLNV